MEIVGSDNLEIRNILNSLQTLLYVNFITKIKPVKASIGKTIPKSCVVFRAQNDPRVYIEHIPALLLIEAMTINITRIEGSLKMYILLYFIKQKLVLC